MPVQSPLNPLTSRQEAICFYGGVFGILMTLACFIQHVVVTISNWITQIMQPLYILPLIAFLLVTLQKRYSWIFLIASAVVSLLLQYLWMNHYSFSLLVLLLFIYHIILIVFILVEQVPQRLKQKQQLELQERKLWEGKI